MLRFSFQINVPFFTPFQRQTPIEPPSATTTTTIGIPANSATFSSAFGKKRAGVATTPSTNRKNKKNKTKDSSPSEPIRLQDPQQVVLAQHKADKNKIHGEPRGGGGGGVTGGTSDSDPLDSTDCASESSSSGGKSQELNFLPDLPSSSSSYSSSSSSSSSSSAPSHVLQPGPEKRHCPQLHPGHQVTVSISKPTQKAPDVSELTPSSSLPFKSMALPVTSPSSKSLASPKRGQKREEGWKEVVRRSKKLSVPASVVSRIMGRGGCNITAIQDVTGAHIDVDKQKDKNGERMITIRGGTESTRHAIQLINALIQDPAKELEDLIPKNHIRPPGSKTMSASYATSGVGSNPSAGTKALASLVTSSGVSFQSSSSSSQAAGKTGKGLSSGVRQPFPVSLPLAYAHPQLALLAAQTIHQIRHPRLPMAQFGGTFSPAPSTWGPFPVRPVSPGSANSSPKHNGGSNGGGSQARSNPPSQNDHSTTPSVSSVSTASVSSSYTATGSPHTPNSLPGAQPSAPTPSSVRKQLFTSDLKHSGVNSVSMVSAPSVSSSNHTVRGSGSPVHQHTGLTASNTANPTVQPQVAPASQPPMSPPSAHMGLPGKEKLAPSLSQEVVSEGVSSGVFNASTLSQTSKPEPRPQHHQPSSLPNLRTPPPLHPTQPSVHLSPSSAPSHTLPNSTTPHFSIPAPRTSHRMQPPTGPYYQHPDQQQHFVPQSTQQQPHPKQSQHPSSHPPPQSSVGLMNGSQSQQGHGGVKTQQMPPNFGPAALFNHFSSMFDNSNQVGKNQVWGSCHLPARSPSEQQYPSPQGYMGMGQMDGMMPPPPPDGSKAPGYRSASQRMVSSPVALTSYATSMSGSQVYLHGPAAVGTPSFSRQHFSPHPWSAASSGESQAAPPPSTVSSSGPAVPPSHQAKQSQGSSQPDRKVPPPIGTERLARIRQTTVNPPLLQTSYTAPVGQGGIWSFGVGSASEAMSGWSQPLMGNPMMHPGLQADQSFSQHQHMEQDDTGMSNPANSYHQQHITHPNSYMDFPKGMPMSMYGGTMLPPHPPMGEGPGGPMFNGLQSADPAWSPIIKVVPNNAENTDPQQVWPGTWAPHVHLNHVN
ncbi:hypothetical protein UPYG_G00211760 [Umbra pygmaea]|uniref:K Homology domain-containing protein n=1 Tax=Umbra pygmaea TaxID=75934 RepID=A0ABD0X3Y7_UMBPY